jgi:hypothetical protein
MAKRLNLATRAFGAEPGIPDVAGLTRWIAEHRGLTADIITYQLDRSLFPQVSAQISSPCAGGKFYAERIRQCITGIRDTRAVGELHVDTSAIIEDAAGIVVQKKGTWCAIPAPHVLGIEDTYYDDDEEWHDAFCGAYSTIMRAMRDTGVAGHVLIADRMEQAELASLARRNIFFFQPEMNPDSCATLMEYQDQIAVDKDAAAMVFDLMNEFTLRKIFLMNPDAESIKRVLTHLDPDQVVAGGYCLSDCGKYWEDLRENAVYGK